MPEEQQQPTGDKPIFYQCPDCDKSFAKKNQLRMHQLGAHGSNRQAGEVAALKAELAEVRAESAKRAEMIAEALSNQLKASVEQLDQRAAALVQQSIEANLKSFTTQFFAELAERQKKQVKEPTEESTTEGSENSKASRLESSIAMVLENIGKILGTVTADTVIKFYEISRPKSSLSDIINQFTALSRFEKAGGDVNALRTLTEGKQ